MRVSNIHITKGTIFIATFPEGSDMAFLNNRPLIAVTYPSNLFNTITFCTTGTRDQPGIKAHFHNYYANKPHGDKEVSHIYPHTTYTAQIKCIRDTLGQIDRFIMKEIDKAIQYFHGFSEEIPGYLIDQKDEIEGVEFNIPTVTVVNTMPSYAYRVVSPGALSMHNKCTDPSPACEVSTPLPAIVPPTEQPHPITKIEPTFISESDYIQERVSEWETEDLCSIKYKRLAKTTDKEIHEIFSPNAVALVITKNLSYGDIVKKYNCSLPSIKTVAKRLRGIYVTQIRAILAHYSETHENIDNDHKALTDEVLKLSDALQIAALFMLWGNNAPDNLSSSAKRVLEEALATTRVRYKMTREKLM